MGLVVPDLSFFAGLAYFSPDLRVFATSAAPPATTHPSIKQVAFGHLHKGRPAPSTPAPLCGFLYGWVWGGWGAADAAETRKSGEK